MGVISPLLNGMPNKSERLVRYSLKLTASLHLKNRPFDPKGKEKVKVVLQPSIFRGYVMLVSGASTTSCKPIIAGWKNPTEFLMVSTRKDGDFPFFSSKISGATMWRGWWTYHKSSFDGGRYFRMLTGNFLGEWKLVRKPLAGMVESGNLLAVKDFVKVDFFKDSCDGRL